MDSMGKQMRSYFGEPLTAYITILNPPTEIAQTTSKDETAQSMYKPTGLKPVKSETLQIIDDLLQQESLSGTYIDEILGLGKLDQGVDEAYYAIAFDLSDKGFGSFDRCLHIMVICNGNRKESERILSKLMMKEAK